MVVALAPSRRDELKARHRAAILDAARALVNERGGPGFSVDELATRADVARRTIFNHFVSIDEILVNLCDDALEVLISDFIATVAAVPAGDDSRESIFNELSESLRSSDLPGAIAGIGLIFGGLGTDPVREQSLTDRAFANAGERLLNEIQRRHPQADTFDAEILIGSLMNGVIVAAKHWTQKEGLRLDAPGRAEWQRLVDRFIVSMRSGYALPT